MIKLPVGDTPGWEVKSEENEETENTLNTVSESCLVYQSLRQSRNAWLGSIFPKFSSKAKGKLAADSNPPPPHTIKYVANCDIQIGPHVFHDTFFYNVQYLPEGPQYEAKLSVYQSNYPSSSSQGPVQSSYSTGKYNYSYPQSATGLGYTSSTESTVAKSDSSVDVTPALIAQVNVAASSNPTLQNLLQVAAAGHASIDQLKTLGLLIQSLAQAPGQRNSILPRKPPPVTPKLLQENASSSSSSSQTPKPAIPLRKPDLVIEFRENQTQRFVIPRQIAAFEDSPSTPHDSKRDVALHTFVPFHGEEKGIKDDESAARKTPVVLRLKRLPYALWDVVHSWLEQDCKQDGALQAFEEEVKANAPYPFLQHRLQEGDLLTQLRASTNNGYVLKPIKPSPSIDSTKPKRARHRKPVDKAPGSSDINDSTSGPSKRKRQSAKAASDCECPSCGRVGVQLIHGGQTCKECNSKGNRSPPLSRVPPTNTSIFVNTTAPSQLDSGPSFKPAATNQFRQSNTHSHDDSDHP